MVWALVESRRPPGGCCGELPRNGLTVCGRNARLLTAHKSKSRSILIPLSFPLTKYLRVAVRAAHFRNWRIFRASSELENRATDFPRVSAGKLLSFVLYLSFEIFTMQLFRIIRSRQWKLLWIVKYNERVWNENIFVLKFYKITNTLPRLLFVFETAFLLLLNNVEFFHTNAIYQWMP